MSKRRSKKLALLRLATVPLASVVWIGRPASADTYCFVSGEGTTWDNTSTLPWYDQTNPLSVAFPPNTGTATAVLGNFGIAHYITSNTNVTFNYTYTTGINDLEIDSGNTLTQSSSGTAMVCSTELLGDDGGATYTQSAGSNTINGANNFALGFASGESSTYNLSGTGQFIDTGSNYGAVGYSGNGTFTQTGGTASVTNELDVGENANSVGVYNLSNTTGTGSLSVGTMVLGYLGSGTFTQASGTNQTGNLISRPEFRQRNLQPQRRNAQGDDRHRQRQRKLRPDRRHDDFHNLYPERRNRQPQRGIEPHLQHRQPLRRIAHHQLYHGHRLEPELDQRLTDPHQPAVRRHQWN